MAAFTATVHFGQASLPVHFTDLSLAGTAAIETWHWDFGDGTTSDAQNPDHLYAEPGVYTVALTVTTADGTDTHAAADYVTVAENDVVAWNSAALEAIAAAQWMPPQAARALAMVHGAIYDAVNAVEKQGAMLHADVTAPQNASKEAAAAHAAYGVLVSFFPARANSLNARLAASMAAIPEGPDKSAGVTLGQSVANNILARRSNDGAQGMMMDPYVGGTGPGQWRPTPPGNSPGMFYHWTMVRPFALATADQFRPGPPPALDSAEYAAAFNEAKSLGAKMSAQRTMDESMMANFWVGMPGTIGEAGRMNLVAQQAAVAHHNTLFDNARLFALVNMALADAAIAGLDCKYHYSFWRPITAIREAENDNNADTDADPAWEPFIATPAHPEYISTHSALTKAAATVLAAFFQTDAADLTLPSFMDAAITRHYDSFSQVAEEAGYSRICGGIHFRFSFAAGTLLGQQVGNHVWNTMLVSL